MYNFNMGDLWRSVFTKLSGASWTEKKGDSITNIWNQLKVSAKPSDKRAGLLHIDLFGSIQRFVNLESLEEEIPKFLADSLKYQKVPYEINLTKYRMLGEYNVRFANELGLPMRYLFTLPLITSTQGTLQGDEHGHIKYDVSAEVSWKITGEIRVDLPFTGNYIATGVDVIVDSHLPREFNFSYKNGIVKIDNIPDKKPVDLIYYHVKPYTVTRNLADSINPTLEDQAAHIISITDKPIQRQWSLGQIIGLNVNLIEHSEFPNSDIYSWGKFMNKWDINSWSNLGCFVPLELNYRKYILRYEPTGTQAKQISTSFFYQYATKTSQNTLLYVSGSSQSKTPSEPEIISTSHITPENRPLADLMFKDLETGNARLMRAKVVAEQQDGSIILLQSTLGLSRDARYSKDFFDWQTELSTTKPNAAKKVNYALCYWAVRDWNNAPTYGFSKDILVMNEVDEIGFGPECEQKVRFTAKLTRDESAAKAAIDSKAGQQCIKDMEAGFKHGSPACTEARLMDQTYNNYVLAAEAKDMSESSLQWARSTATWLNNILSPFIVEHRHAQTNTPYSASWTIKRDPITGDSDMTFIRPHETVVAKNVRWGFSGWQRFSPLTYAYAKVFYPLKSGTNFLIDALDITSAGVSESKCYVGENAVHTFDGAHYKYTINECPHVLMTDCHKKSGIAVIARAGKEGQKIVTVIYGKDTYELDPNGFVVVNGEKTAFNSIKKGSFIEIRTPENNDIQAVVYPLADGGVMLDIRTNFFFIKIQGSHVELSAPVHIRGRACGLCGDFNQENKDEFKTADRCVVSSGELMAASFMVCVLVVSLIL